jgi:transposase-like protein
MSIMARDYGQEFRHNVVEIAQKDRTAIAEISKDFGISEAVIRRSLARTGIEGGLKPVATVMESADRWKANKHIRPLEMGNVFLRRALPNQRRGVNPK